MAGILDWLDTAYVMLDNPTYKKYDEAKHRVGALKAEAKKSELASFISDWERKTNVEEAFMSSKYIRKIQDQEDVKKWGNKTKKKKPKEKLSHYEKVKRKLKKKTDEKRLKQIKKLKEKEAKNATEH